jgi:hypothetical protein
VNDLLATPINTSPIFKPAACAKLLGIIERVNLKLAYSKAQGAVSPLIADDFEALLVSMNQAIASSLRVHSALSPLIFDAGKSVQSTGDSRCKI